MVRSEDADNIGRPLSDAEAASPEMVRLRESAYRRGYQQGMAEAVRMAEAGRSTQAIRRHMEEPVADWRFDYNDLSRATLPPLG